MAKVKTAKKAGMKKTPSKSKGNPFAPRGKAKSKAKKGGNPFAKK